MHLQLDGALAEVPSDEAMGLSAVQHTSIVRAGEGAAFRAIAHVVNEHVFEIALSRITQRTAWVTLRANRSWKASPRVPPQ